MSDTINGVVVTFDKDYSGELAEKIVHAILMVKGVVEVTTNVVDARDLILRNQVKRQLEQQLYDVLK